MKGLHQEKEFTTSYRQKEEDWFPFRYMPAPKEGLMVQDNWPVMDSGTLSFLNFSMGSHTSAYRNACDYALEIEHVLQTNSEFTNEEINFVMEFLLPNTTELLQFLKDTGQKRALACVHEMLKQG